MAFERLLNKPMPECDLLDEVVVEIRENYFEYQDRCFYLKLSKTKDDRASQVAWIKTIDGEDNLFKFYSSHEFEQACIMIKYRAGEALYSIYCHGYLLSQIANTKEYTTQKDHPIKITWDKERQKMPNFNLLDAGFSEILGILKSSSKKAI